MRMQLQAIRLETTGSGRRSEDQPSIIGPGLETLGFKKSSNSFLNVAV